MAASWRVTDVAADATVAIAEVLDAKGVVEEARHAFIKEHDPAYIMELIAAQEQLRDGCLARWQMHARRDAENKARSAEKRSQTGTLQQRLFWMRTKNTSRLLIHVKEKLQQVLLHQQPPP